MAANRFPKAESKAQTEAEFRLLRAMGRKVNKELFDLGKSVEWLAFESNTARSTIRRMFDGEGNVTILTVDRVAKALGYKDAVAFFKAL